MKHTYTIELDLTKYHLHLSLGVQWTEVEALSTFGDSFEELINNAEIFFVDQDGGEVGSCSLNASPMSNKIYNDIYLDIARVYHTQMVEVMKAEGWTTLAPYEVHYYRRKND